jgi:hypothetical protein
VVVRRIEKSATVKLEAAITIASIERLIFVILKVIYNINLLYTKWNDNDIENPPEQAPTLPETAYNWTLYGNGTLIVFAMHFL